MEAIVSMCSADNVHQLLDGNPDFVLDAIDNIQTKVGSIHTSSRLVAQELGLLVSTLKTQIVCSPASG